MKNYVMGRVDLRIRLKLPQEVIQDDLAAVVKLGEIFFKTAQLCFFLPAVLHTVKLQAVDRSTIQFWNFLAKGHST